MFYKFTLVHVNKSDTLVLRLKTFRLFKIEIACPRV
jgi:hypothetical protein